MHDLTHQTKRVPSGQDVLSQKITEVDTSPLTRLNISKKHVRILVALFMVNDLSDANNLYLNLKDIPELVAQICYKRYPYLDVVSFANDLSIRNYVTTEISDDNEVCYKITELGISLLEKLSQMPHMYLTGSKTPNYYPVVH